MCLLVPNETLFTDRFVAAVWRHDPDAEEPLTFAQLDHLPYLSYTVGPVDSLLRGLGHPRAPDAIVESFVLGPLLVRGTRQITFVHERLAHRLVAAAELRLLDHPLRAPC